MTRIQHFRRASSNFEKQSNLPNFEHLYNVTAMSEARGEALLSLFRACGCPGIDSWVGQDLDWLWEGAPPDRIHFLTWLCDRMESRAAAMTLQDHELAAWKEMMERGADVLEGQMLEEALKVRRAKKRDQVHT